MAAGARRWSGRQKDWLARERNSPTRAPASFQRMLGGASKWAMSEGRLREHVNHSLPTLCVGGNAEILGADLLNRPPRPTILRPNDEEDLIDRLESVFQHQALHLAVVSAAPIRTSQKRPANLYYALYSVEALETRRSNDLPRRTVDGHQRATRIEGVSKELPEDIFFVTVRLWMLLPDERIRRDGEERRPVARP